VTVGEAGLLALAFLAVLVVMGLMSTISERAQRLVVSLGFLGGLIVFGLILFRAVTDPGFLP
jgi:hypothetical protein